MLTISDSIALKIFNKNILFAGVGNEFRVFTENFEYKVPIKLKGKVHGIACEDSSKNVLIYGEKEFAICEPDNDTFRLAYRGFLSDWISSGKILENNLYVLVTAHSVALLLKYDKLAKSCEIQDKVSCTDKSTLYCSYIHGSSWETLLVLGGNAFGELLVWQPSVKSSEYCDKAKLLRRKRGHNGVIFSIDIDLESGLLVTTSDDRSIRFWDVSLTQESNNCVNFAETLFTPRKSGYSHVARVFTAKIIHECGKIYVLTGGEDSYICLWNRNCELVFKRRQQFGATIWALDYDSPSKTAFTSGSSGNILKYALEECFMDTTSTMSVINSETLNLKEFIGKIKFLDQETFVAVTSKNRLMYRNKFGDKDWNVVESFTPSKCTLLEVHNSLVAVAGYKRVTLYKFNQNSSSFKQIYHGEVLAGVIRSFIFISETEFLISDEMGNCKLIKNESFEDFLSIDLPLCKERWITAACKVNSKFLVISNRQGSLMLYSLSEDGSNLNLCDTLKRLHGNLGATTITAVSGDKDAGILKSTGHDSTIKTIKLDKVKCQLTVLSRKMIPVAWVEGIVVPPKCSNELIFGFNDNHFVLWSSEMDTHFEISCGGGHRCWDLHPQVLENTVQVVFIKNKQVFLHQKRIFNESKIALNIPRNNWHVKPCNVLGSINGQNSYLVSGGDDNLLKISKFNSERAELIQLYEIHSHISNIRGLRILTIHHGNHLIFSSGGRAQICVTLFDETSHIIQELIDFSIQKEIRSQDIRCDPETRVMSIDVRKIEDYYEIFAGCSDGYLRKFTMKNMLFCQDLQVFYGKCILHIRLASYFLSTVGTDGVVCFWTTDNLKLVEKCPHHKSGVNSFDIRVINEDEFHLLTGGDDQQVVYSKLLLKGGSLKTITLHRMNYLHTAQVTAVMFSPCMKYFYSSSLDQVLKRVDLKSFASNWETFLCVADVKGIEITQSNNNEIIFVYGCGLQVIELPENCL